MAFLLSSSSSFTFSVCLKTLNKKIHSRKLPIGGAFGPASGKTAIKLKDHNCLTRGATLIDNRNIMGKKLTAVKEDATGILSSDVLFQVLSRLPPKSLVRFRCVSKQWRNFISDPFFVDFHYNQSKKKKPLMVWTVRFLYVGLESGCFEVTLIDPLNPCSTEIFSLNLEPDQYYDVLYCSGLLLFYGKNHCYVCNPSTRECFPTKHYLHKESSQKYRSYKLKKGGFGVLPSTAEYKFVIVLSPPLHEDTDNVSVVITLPSKRGVGSTKYMPVHCLHFEDYLDLSSVEEICVSGIIYWPMIRGCHESRMDLLFAFDLESEVFRVITCPLHDKSYSDYSLLDFEGELCLVDSFYHQPIIDFWVLKDHKNEIWAKIHTIDYSHFDREWSHEGSSYHLQVVAGNDGEKVILIKSCVGIFYYYNLKAKMLTKMGDCRDRISIGIGRAFVHHDSLLQVPSCTLVKPTGKKSI